MVQWITSSSNWSSNNTGVATVQTYGQTSPGRVTAAGVGSAHIDAMSRYMIPVNAGQVCSPEPIPCPSTYPSGGGGANVSPTVSVTPGPTSIVAYYSDPVPSACVDITASGQPSGGTFNWTTGSSKVTLINTTSNAVHVCAKANSWSTGAADVDISVTYTVSGTSSNVAHTKVTILKPNGLALRSDSLNGSGHTCIQGAGTSSCSQSYYQDTVAGSRYTSYCRNRTYNVTDQLSGAAIQFNMALTESYTPAIGNIGSGSGVIVTDCFYYCSQKCRQQQPDSVSATQTIYANGFQIATKSVQWTCSDALVP